MKITLTEQIMEKIAFQVTTGQLKSGEKLPTERELAEVFSVTRNRVREALRALSLVGIITIKPSGGSYVSKESTKIPKETVTWVYYKEVNNFSDVYAARELIETEVYLTCFDNKTPEIVNVMKSIMTEIIKNSEDDNSSETFIKLLSKLDLYVGENSNNGIYSKLMQTIVLLREESSLKALKLSGSKEISITCRSKIVKAFESNNREAVKKSLEEFYRKSIENLKPIN